MLVSVVVVVAVKVWRGSRSGYHTVGIINYTDTSAPSPYLLVYGKPSQFTTQAWTQTIDLLPNKF